MLINLVGLWTGQAQISYCSNVWHTPQSELVNKEAIFNKVKQ